MIIIWCMVPEIQSTTEFFVILDYLLPFYPPNNPENQNFEKMEKPPGDINILHMCTINDNHMMYGSWDMKCDRHNFFIILDHLFPFYPPPLNNPKIIFLKKMKNCLEISSFYNCTKNHGHMLHCSWDMMCGRCNFHFSFWAIFCPFTPLTT